MHSHVGESSGNRVKRLPAEQEPVSLVEYVRVSLGTAMALGLETGSSPAPFSAAFLMTHSENGCLANCAFCPQARESKSKPEMLSRIGWPRYRLTDVLSRLKTGPVFDRVCIQSLNYPRVTDDVVQIVSAVRECHSAPVSVCIHPLSREDMMRLHQAGVQNIGVAFDACTPELFDAIKGKDVSGPYTWEKHRRAITAALGVFGQGHVTTHLIIGLGESERQAADFLFMMGDVGITVGLFAFTSVKGTRLEDRKQPNIGSYRRLQVLRYLIARGAVRKDQIAYTDEGEIRLDVPVAMHMKDLSSGAPFRVSGCPGCNRPFYNERPRGPVYNYFRPLMEDEASKALKESELV